MRPSTRARRGVRACDGCSGRPPEFHALSSRSHHELHAFQELRSFLGAPSAPLFHFCAYGPMLCGYLCRICDCAISHSRTVYHVTAKYPASAHYPPARDHTATQPGEGTMRKFIIRTVASISFLAASVPAFAEPVGHYRAATGIERQAQWVAAAPEGSN
jgi:hypothetical protein